MVFLNRWFNPVSVTLLLLIGLTKSASAQEDQTGPVSLRQAAAALAEKGEANDDPRAVLAAAQLLILADRGVSGITSVGGSVADSTWPDDVRKTWLLTATSLLRLASRMAEDHNDAATALAAAELATNPTLGIQDPILARELRNRAQGLANTRGATGGPLWRDGYLGAGQKAEYRVSFEGRRVANRLDVTPSNPRANLECVLVDGTRETVGERSGGACSLKWDQKTTGKVILRVTNNGVASYYVISSN